MHPRLPSLEPVAKVSNFGRSARGADQECRFWDKIVHPPNNGNLTIDLGEAFHPDGNWWWEQRVILFNEFVTLANSDFCGCWLRGALVATI